jgi:exosortase
LLLSLFLFREPLGQLASLALRDERYSYIPVIPLISLVLIYLDRKRIFRESRAGWSLSLVPLAAAALLQPVFSSYAALSSGDYGLSWTIFGILLLWLSGFLLHYGWEAFRSAYLPLLWLALVIPIPSAALDHVVTFFQRSTAEATYYLFKLSGIPVLRQAFRFSLPGVEIEIATQCSGIRSSVALLITAVLAGHLFLRSASAKVGLALLTVPVVIFKNALRIFTITWLGMHVNPVFLKGELHHYGGLPFSLIALAILLPLLLALRRAEMAADHARLKVAGAAFPAAK